MKHFLICWGALLWSSASLAVDPFSVANPAHMGQARSAYVDGALFIANDLVPLKEINKDWSQGYSPRSGTNLALVSSRVETGVEWNGYRLGLISRNEWLAEANRDTLDVVRADRQDLPYDTGRTYALDYHLRGFAADGVKLAKAFSQPLADGWTLDWGVAGSVLKGKRIRVEDITGSATATGGGKYTGSIDWKRDYSHTDTIKEGFWPANQFGNPEGQGYAIDLGVSVGRIDGLRMEWAIADAISHMQWKDIPERIRNSSGLDRNSRVNTAERLPLKHSLSLSIPVNQAHLELGDTYMAGYHFPRIGVSQRYGKDWATRLDYDARFKTWGLALMHRWFYVNVQSDALSLDKARAFGLGMGLRIEF